MPLSPEGRQLRAALVQARLQAQARRRQAVNDNLTFQLQQAFYCRGFPDLKYRG